MKRRDLERRLRRAGCWLKREGASHALWINPSSGVVEAIPRPGEIKEPLAGKILKPHAQGFGSDSRGHRCGMDAALTKIAQQNL